MSICCLETKLMSAEYVLQLNNCLEVSLTRVLMRTSCSCCVRLRRQRSSVSQKTFCRKTWIQGQSCEMERKMLEDLSSRFGVTHERKHERKHLKEHVLKRDSETCVWKMILLNTEVETRNIYLQRRWCVYLFLTMLVEHKWDQFL